MTIQELLKILINFIRKKSAGTSFSSLTKLRKMKISKLINKVVK